MPDRALINAQQRRDVLAAEINKLNQDIEVFRKELAKITQWIDDWHRFAGKTPRDADTKVSAEHTGTALPTGPTGPSLPWHNGPLSPPSPMPPGASRPRPVNPDRKEVGRAAYRIIGLKERPVLRQDLFKELTTMGIIIHGKDPEMVLSTMMWRMQDIFIRLPKWGYWIRSHPYAPAGYIPGGAVEDDGEDANVAAMANAEEE